MHRDARSLRGRPTIKWKLGAPCANTAMTFVKRIHFEELADAMSGRRGRTRARCLVGLFFAMLYILILPWSVVGGWLLAFGTVQFVEWWAFEPRRVRPPDTVWSIGWSLSSLAAQSTVFGWLGLEIIQRVSPLGTAIGSCYLLACLLITTMGIHRSKLALCAATTPHILLLAAAAFILHAGPVRVPLTQSLVLSGVGAIVAIFAALIWSKTADLSRSEAAARSAAQSANAAKSNFIATVSHELRTPISAIQAGAVDLDRSLADPSQRRRAGLILDAAHMMRTLLDDLLDLSKVEAGRMEVETISFDARRLIADTLRFWQAHARKKGVRLGLRGAKALPQWLEGDPTRLRQVLNNLISNAIKFTDEGGVTLHIAREGTRLRLTVEDEGVGMSPDQQTRLFTPFGQADNTVARTHGGTGLGLALSRDLARLMGGDLTFESTMGRGSRFTLSIPLVVADGPNLEAGVACPPEADLPPLRVLAVDDHEINRRATGLLLEALGLQATFASDGEEALEMLWREDFDVVLMDVHMPKLDGLEVTRIVRGRAGPNRATPIIAVSGASEPADRAICLGAGMTDCVGKPIDLRELHNALVRALGPALEEDAESAAIPESAGPDRVARVSARA